MLNAVKQVIILGTVIDVAFYNGLWPRIDMIIFIFPRENTILELVAGKKSL